MLRDTRRTSKRREASAIRDRLQHRSLAFLEGNLLPERVRHHQNVGKEDRSIEAIAPDRLQGHFLGELRRVAEIEKATCLCPDLAILRQIASCLAHHPERHALRLDTGKRSQQFLLRKLCSGSHSLAHAFFSQIYKRVLKVVDRSRCLWMSGIKAQPGFLHSEAAFSSAPVSSALSMPQPVHNFSPSERRACLRSDLRCGSSPAPIALIAWIRAAHPQDSPVIPVFRK